MSEVRLTSFARAMAVIDAEREFRELSIPAFAALAGSAINSIYGWRAGARTPNVDSLIRVAAALGFEIVMRRSAEKPGSTEPHSYLAQVMDLKCPVKIKGRKVDRLIFRPLKGSDIRVLAKHQESAAAEMMVAISLATGEPAEVISALHAEDIRRAGAIIENRVFGTEVL